jgi:hypothetical protein
MPLCLVLSIVMPLCLLLSIVFDRPALQWLKEDRHRHCNG